MGAVAIMMRQVNDPFPPAAQVDPEIDSAVSDWIDRMLVKRIEQRARNAMVGATVLEGIITGLLGPFWPLGARLPSPPTLHPPRSLTLPRLTTHVGAGPVELEPLIAYETPEPRTSPHEARQAPQLRFLLARRARFGSKEVNRVIR